MPLTSEERERLAYIAGDVELAAALAGHTDVRDDRIDELKHEVRSLKDDNDQLDHENDTLRDEIEARDNQIAEVTRDLEMVSEEHLAFLVGDA